MGIVEFRRYAESIVEAPPEWTPNFTRSELLPLARAYLSETARYAKQIETRCVMCGAEPGHDCIVISDPELGGPGAVRPYPHFYR